MYAKIFRQILESSIAEKPELRFTFMDMLILADLNGVVDMTHESIARITSRPLDLVKQTILELEQPDPKSRTPDASGARIKRLDDHRDWGWLIVNYEYFRKTASEEQRREKTRNRVRKFKERNKLEEGNALVTHGNAGNAMQMQKQMHKHREVPKSFAERISAEKELERIKERRKELRGQASEDAFGPKYTAEQHSELKRLIERQKELKTSIGCVA